MCLAARTGLVRKLVDTVTDEVVKSMGLSPSGWARTLVAPAVWPAAKRFAELFATFDQDVRIWKPTLSAANRSITGVSRLGSPMWNAAYPQCLSDGKTMTRDLSGANHTLP